MAVSAMDSAGEQVKWATGSSGEDLAAVVGPGRDVGPTARSGGQQGSTLAARRSGVQQGSTLAARALLRLLRVTAVTGSDRGWSDVLYTSFVGVLSTASATMFVWGNATYGLTLLRVGKSIVYVASLTAFFGLQYVLMWLSLMSCFVAGRRPYGRLLLTIGKLMERNGLHESAVVSKKLRNRFNWLLRAVVGLMVLTFAMAFRTTLLIRSCSTVAYNCLFAAVYGLLLGLFFFSAYLIPFKLVFASLQISAGFSTINLELKAVVDGERPPDLRELCRLRSLQDDLSRTFARLTADMSAELMTLMLSGTLQMIAILMQLIAAAEAGHLASVGVLLSLYLCGAAVAVVLPCETTQWVLNAVGETRDLLLRAEWQRPELFQELCLFRETVGRDLDTLGDLGLFRLQRPTLLAIAATILTYVIVLVQFFVTERSVSP